MFTREQILHIKASLPWRKHFKPVKGSLFWKRSQARRSKWVQWRQAKWRQLAQRRLPVARRIQLYRRLFTNALPHLRRKAYQRSHTRTSVFAGRLAQSFAIVFVLCLGFFLSPPDFSGLKSERAEIQAKAPFVAAIEHGSSNQLGPSDWDGHQLNINPYSIPPLSPENVVYYSSPLPPLNPQAKNGAFLQQQSLDLQFVKVN